MDQLFAKLNTDSSFASANLADLEIGRNYKANNFRLLNTKYGKKTSVTLHDKFKVLLPYKCTKLYKNQISN